MSVLRRALPLAALVLATAAIAWLLLACLRAGAQSGPPAWVSGAGLALAACGAIGAALGADRLAEPIATAAARIASLSMALLLGAALALLALGHLPVGRERNLVWPAAAGAAAALLLARPMHRRLMSRAAGAIPQLRRAPRELAGRVAAVGAQDVPVEEVLLRAAELLRSSLRADAVEVWAAPSAAEQPVRVIALPERRPDGARLLSADELAAVSRAGVAGRAWLQMWLPALLDGLDAAHVRIATIAYRDALLGWLLVSRASGDAPFDPADDAALGETAERLAAALHSRQLSGALRSSLVDLQHANEALAASRRRLVAAADTERRRIERDLHDGAQQHLVALAVNLSLARGLLASAPQDADELMAQMADQVRDAVRELRDLAHGIYPALLKEGGLAQALTGSLSGTGRHVRFDIGAVGRLDPTTEAAIYFCCVEAVQNAAKHAPGAAVLIRLGRTEDAVWFSVADEGPGFDPARTSPGFGRLSMADRLGAVDGVVRWETAPGRGTTVSGYVPIRAGAEAASR